MKQEKLASFIRPIEKSFTPSVATSDIYRIRFRYPYVKALEVNNAVGILTGVGGDVPYQYQGGRGVLMVPGQIIFVQPGQDYEIVFLPQLGHEFVLWNHPDQAWLQTMNAGASSQVDRLLNLVVPGGGTAQLFTWIDSKICAAEFHFLTGAGPGAALDIEILSIPETINFVFGVATPISIHTFLGVAQNAEVHIGLSKCSTVLPALAANIAQSRVFGRWLRFYFAEGMLADIILSRITIKLDQH